jgi:hypothetical protein
MDQRDSHCPYSLSSETTAKPTVLGVLVCQFAILGLLCVWYFLFLFRELWACWKTGEWTDFAVSHLHNSMGWRVGFQLSPSFFLFRGIRGLRCTESVCCRLFNFLFVQQRGKKTLLSLTLICHCHLVGLAKIVRGSTLWVRPWNTATWRFGWLTVILMVLHYSFFVLSCQQEFTLSDFEQLRFSLFGFFSLPHCRP